MRIIELHPPTNYSWLYSGLAVNARGQRYKFQTTVDGVTGVAVREPVVRFGVRSLCRQL